MITVLLTLSKNISLFYCCLARDNAQSGRLEQRQPTVVIQKTQFRSSAVNTFKSYSDIG
jgi:hypothetical protein